MIYNIENIEGYDFKEWLFLRHYLQVATYYKFRDFYNNELSKNIALSNEFTKVLEYQFEYAKNQRDEEQSNVQRVGEISYFDNKNYNNSRSNNSKNNKQICDTLYYWLAAHNLFDRRLRQSYAWVIPDSWEINEDC